MKKKLPPYIVKLIRTVLRGEDFEVNPSRIPKGWRYERVLVEPGRWRIVVEPKSRRVLEGHGKVICLCVDGGSYLYKLTCPVYLLPDAEAVRQVGEASLVNLATGHAIPDPIARALLEALDRAQRRVEELKTPGKAHFVPWLEADGMCGALHHALDELATKPIAKVRGEIEAAIGEPCQGTNADLLRSIAPLGEPDLRTIRDRVYRRVIALLSEAA